VSSVANNLDVLQAGLADDGAYGLKDSQGQQGGEFIEQANQVSQVSKLMMQAMDEARVRLDKSRKTGSGEEAKTGKIEQADQAQALAEELKGVIKDAGYLTVLGEVSTHIVNFTDKLNEYTGLLASEAQVSKQLAGNARQVVDQVNQAYAAEDDSMQAQLK